MAQQSKWPHFLIRKTEAWTLTSNLAPGWLSMDAHDGFVLIVGDLLNPGAIVAERERGQIVELPADGPIGGLRGGQTRIPGRGGQRYPGNAARADDALFQS
jgi:hypothetical protein